MIVQIICWWYSENWLVEFSYQRIPWMIRNLWSYLNNASCAVRLKRYPRKPNSNLSPCQAELTWRTTSWGSTRRSTSWSPPLAGFLTSWRSRCDTVRSCFTIPSRRWQLFTAFSVSCLKCCTQRWRMWANAKCWCSTRLTSCSPRLDGLIKSNWIFELDFWSKRYNS